MFFFNKIGEQEGRTGSAWKRGVGSVGGVAQTVYTHIGKCKKYKILKEEKKIGRFLHVEIKSVEWSGFPHWT
jgi:hypothetical protein